jgi:tetratricopeptide (TPR) repeat protein
MATIGIILTLTIYHTNVKAWRFHDLTTIAVGAFMANADDSFLWYREAMKNSTYLGRQELYKRFGNYANAKYELSDLQDQRKVEEFRYNLKYAISEMENAVAENKEDVQFYSLLGALYNKYYSNFKEPGYIDKAETTLQRAVELSPERETVYYEYGQTMVFKKDYRKAVELFKRGVELNPPVPISHWYLGMAYLNAKEYSSADAEISEAIKLGYGYKTIKDLLSITPIYIELKDYRRLEKIYLDVLDLDPNNPEIYVSLALVYKELGDKTSAIKMAEKAISLDESFRAEGEKFVDELEGGK